MQFSPNLVQISIALNFTFYYIYNCGVYYNQLSNVIFIKYAYLYAVCLYLTFKLLVYMLAYVGMSALESRRGDKFFNKKL